MIQIRDKKECCGCNACGDACAHGAITFKTDIEGFWYPEVDKDKCVDCGLCEKVCPIINVDKLKKNDFAEPICYAAEHKNIEVVFDSTSGGLFSALADIMYKSGGYVGGAVFNDDFSVRQYISNDRNDLPRLRSSKYLQSSLEGFFKQVRALVKAGEQVLVCGGPCQMAAMRSFLGRDYDNLIIADYICRGINSPKVWRKYLDSFEERYGSKVVYCKAKSKEYGWRNLTQKVILADGRHVYETREQSNYTKGYLRTNVYCRPSCYDCRFKGYPRIADITLADFWGIERISSSMEKDLGTSLVMVNSKKGQAYFERVKTRVNCVEVPFHEAERGNPALNKPLAAPLVDREKFFRDLETMSFLEVARRYIQPTRRTLRSVVKRVLVNVYTFVSSTRLHLVPMWQFFRYNSLSEIVHGNVLLPTPHCCLRIQRGAVVTKHGVTVVGGKGRFPKSHLETRLFVERGGTLNLGPHTKIGYGSSVEVFRGGTLTFKGHGGSNIGFTCICADHVEFGDGVMMGRNVTVRDNNGAHYINRQGYRNTRPVIVGDKAWLCESCTIMSGVHIGDGAIVGAKSFVIRNVPAHAMVSGHPAEVIDEDVLWKY